VHLSIDGWRIKTVPSRLSAVDLARLRQNGACPAGPPPAGNALGALAADSCVEVQRLVNAAGIITLGNQVIPVGSPLAGQRARLRLTASPPLIARRAAQATGPPLRPQGCFASRCATALRAALTPETSAAPGGRKSGGAGPGPLPA